MKIERIEQDTTRLILYLTKSDVEGLRENISKFFSEDSLAPYIDLQSLLHQLKLKL